MKTPENQIGPWSVDPASGELRKGTVSRRLEPKSLDLLLLLAREPGRVFTREEIFAAVWPGVTVADDTLARAVSKLRKALDDDPKAPRFIETLPKRGYRLIAAPETVGTAGHSRRWPALAAGVVALALAVAGWNLIQGGMRGHEDRTNPLISRADDFYFQYTMQDNEAAIALYERIAAAEPENAQALAGLANALVQKVMRWPVDAGDTRGELTSLGAALSSGRLAEPAAHPQLERAQGLAREAVRLAPEAAYAHKALGLVLSANGDLAAALDAYETALARDPEAWGALINVGDVLELSGRREEALPYFERAYAAMDRAYASESARIRPWQARLGVVIAERHAEAGNAPEAEHWFRGVLALTPFDPEATRGLAGLLKRSGAVVEAESICRQLEQKSGGAERCEDGDQPGPI